MSTLLEKAKTEKSFAQTKPRKYNYDENELLDLAIAFARREVNSGQVKKALNYDTTSVHHYIAGYLLTAIRNGKVRVVKVTS